MKRSKKGCDKGHPPIMPVDLFAMPAIEINSFKDVSLIAKT